MNRYRNLGGIPTFVGFFSRLFFFSGSIWFPGFLSFEVTKTRTGPILMPSDFMICTSGETLHQERDGKGQRSTWVGGFHLSDVDEDQSYSTVRSIVVILINIVS